MPRQSSILVLAASTYQIPFIEAARRLGCRVITADNRPDNPGHALADQSFVCNTTDIQALLRLAREQKVDGVVAAATDVALDAAAEIASHLGLAGPSIECAATLTRKLKFRQLQSRLGLPHPSYSGSMLHPEFAPLWIVKPNRASGSKGVRIVSQSLDIVDAWVQAERESVDGLAVLEECVSGDHGTIEGVMSGGRIAAALETDRLTVPMPSAATRGHRTPGSLTPSARLDLHTQVESVFEHLSYRDGPFDGDFLVRDDGRCVLIELTPRAGGNSLVRLLEHAVGFDMPEYVVMSALGKGRAPPPFEPMPVAVEILGVNRDGLLQYDIGEVGRLAEEPTIRYIHMEVSPGTPVRAFRDGRHRVGEMIAAANNQEELRRIIDRALERIKLHAT